MELFSGAEIISQIKEIYTYYDSFLCCHEKLGKSLKDSLFFPFSNYTSLDSFCVRVSHGGNNTHQ
jgi:hypothetical protein